MSGQSATSVEVKTDDGRRLAVDITGADDGMPVFLLHGTPGSRTGPKPRSSVLYRDRVRLICYDRPGYGGSTPHPGRNIADAAQDVACIADDLGLERFAVVGRSGGGPHALACAALLPARVARTLVLVSVAPSDANDLDWFQDMAVSNVDAYSTADADDRTAIVEWLTFRADRTRSDPESMINAIRKEMGDGDGRVLDDPAFRQLLTDTYVEAFRAGPDGWIDDVLAFRRPWGFSFDTITGPVRFWHGAGDAFSPVEHSRWLARQIPQAIVDVQPGRSHFGAVEILPRLLPWLTAWRDDDQPPHRTDRPTERPAPAGRPHDREPARAARP